MSHALPGSFVACRGKPGITLCAFVLVLAAAAPVTAVIEPTITVRVDPVEMAPGGRNANLVTITNPSDKPKDYDIKLTRDVLLEEPKFKPVGDLAECPQCSPNSTCSTSKACYTTHGPDLHLVSLRNVPAGKTVRFRIGTKVSASALHDSPNVDLKFEAEVPNGTNSPAKNHSITKVTAAGAMAPVTLTLFAENVPGGVLKPDSTLRLVLYARNVGVDNIDLTVHFQLDPALKYSRHSTINPTCPGTSHSGCLDTGALTGDGLTYSFKKLTPGSTANVKMYLSVAKSSTSEHLATEVSATALQVDRNWGPLRNSKTLKQKLDVCYKKPNGTSCDNGDSCSGDKCHAETCRPQPCPAACQGEPNGTPCVGTNACEKTTCKNNACVAEQNGSGQTVEIACRACQSCNPSYGCEPRPASWVCRPGAGTCLLDAKCDGHSASCPATAEEPSGPHGTLRREEHTPCDDDDPRTIDTLCVAQCIRGGVHEKGDECKKPLETGQTHVDLGSACVGKVNLCGNGAVDDPAEQCDDGTSNGSSSSCCDHTCKFKTSSSSCDDSNVCNGADSCNATGHCIPGADHLECSAGSVCKKSGQCHPETGCYYPPNPRTDCISGFRSATLVVNERRKGNEKLWFEMSRGPEISRDQFGDPIGPGGTAYTACFYRADNGDYAGELKIDRAGATCGKRPCWRSVAKGQGYHFTDKTYASDGVGAIRLRANRAGKSHIELKARNRASRGQSSMPAGEGHVDSGIASGLEYSFTGAHVQLRVPGGGCFAADLDEVRNAASVLFRAYGGE